jgi:DNA-binding NtrC family response regulator
MSVPTSLPPAIVLVDDEPDVRHLLRRILMYAVGSCELIAVGTAVEALATLRTRNVLLLITDYNMPKINGLQLMQAAKKASPTTVVIIISAYVTPELEKGVKKAGADYFLPKPFPFDRLEAIVKAVLAS